MVFHKEYIEFNLAEDFSPFPGGRHDEDSYFSADSLKRHLFYLLEENKNKIIIVNIDGTTDLGEIIMTNKYIEVPKTAMDTQKIITITCGIFGTIGVGLVVLMKRRYSHV